MKEHTLLNPIARNLRGRISFSTLRRQIGAIYVLRGGKNVLARFLLKKGAIKLGQKAYKSKK
jgi:hypothetical protein